MLRARFGVSERRACRVVGQHRSTQRLEPPPPSDDEVALRAFLREFSTDVPAGDGAARPRRPGGRVGLSTTSVSGVCGVTRASGSLRSGARSASPGSAPMDPHLVCECCN